jgi:hypothetical protein
MPVSSSYSKTVRGKTRKTRRGGQPAAADSTGKMSTLEFVPFIEYNTKENETFIFYLQWTGNEEQLTLLAEATGKAIADDMDGDFSLFSMDIGVKIPESAVDLHTKIKTFNGYFEMFTKCTGKFQSPFTLEEIDSIDGYEMAKLLDETFFATKIRQWFSDYGRRY